MPLLEDAQGGRGTGGTPDGGTPTRSYVQFNKKLKPFSLAACRD
jgi:hypothetical protein